MIPYKFFLFLIIGIMYGSVTEMTLLLILCVCIYIIYLLIVWRGV